MQIKDILQYATQKLEKLDAELLLASALNKPRSFLYAHPEYEFNPNKFNKLLSRRLTGEPIAYILGAKEFWSLNLKITKDVLIPRPETELLVELALTKFPQKNNIKLADLGTGSGAIALAIAKERPNWEIIATDISSKALEIAKYNVTNLNIKNIKFITNNWCQNLDHDFDIIISNPPYVAENTNPKFEPTSALISSENGLHDLKIIINQAKNYLKHSGVLMLEHGFDQHEEIHDYMQQQNYTNIKTHKDLAGLPRVTIGQI